MLGIPKRFPGCFFFQSWVHFLSLQHPITVVLFFLWIIYSYENIKLSKMDGKSIIIPPPQNNHFGHFHILPPTFFWDYFINKNNIFPLFSPIFKNPSKTWFLITSQWPLCTHQSLYLIEGNWAVPPKLHSEKWYQSWCWKATTCMRGTLSRWESQNYRAVALMNLKRFTLPAPCN